MFEQIGMMEKKEMDWYYGKWPSTFILYLFRKFYGMFAQFEPQLIARHLPQSPPLAQVTNKQFVYTTRAFLKSSMVCSLM